MNFDLIVENLFSEAEEDIKAGHKDRAKVEYELNNYRTQKQKIANIIKNNLFKSLVDFTTMCCGKEVASSYDNLKDDNYKPSETPTEEKFNELKSRIITQLDHINSVKNSFYADNRKELEDIEKETRHKIERINYSELDFDEPEETPKSAFRRYGLDYDNYDVNNTKGIDLYDKEANSKKKTLRFNDDIYQEMKPLISSLKVNNKEYFKPGNNFKNDYEDMQKELVRDQLSKKEKTNIQQRYKNMENAIVNGDDDFSEYKKARETEKNLGKVSDKKEEAKDLRLQIKQLKKDGNDNTEAINKLEDEKKLVKNEQDAAFKQNKKQELMNSMNVSSITEYLKKHNIKKITNTKVDTLFNYLKSDGNELKILSSLNADSGSGNLALIKSGPDSVDFNGWKVIFIDAKARRDLMNASKGINPNQEYNEVGNKIKDDKSLTKEVLTYLNSQSSVKSKFNY